MSVLRRLASQSLVIFGARLVGSGCAFATQALIARLWSPALLGDYLFVIAAVNIAATAMPLGFQVVGAYFAAEYRAYAAGRSLRTYMRQAYGQTAAIALALAAGGTLAVHIVFGTSAIVRSLWPPGALMAAATAVVYLNGALLSGLKRPIAGLLADILFRPMLALLGFALAASTFKSDPPLAPMLWFAAATYCGVAAIQSGLVLRTIKAMPDGTTPDRGTRARWWRFALPWAVIALATDYFFDIDLVLLSYAMGRDDLAVFGVCARVCSLLGFGVGTVYTLTMPDILEAGARRNAHEFQRRIGDANLAAAALAVILALAMFASGPLLVLFFGARFAAGSLPLGILTLGLVSRAVMGPAPLVLSFHDRPYAALPAAGIGLLSLILANAVLVPTCGLVGAALAAWIAITLWSAALWVTARRDVNVDVSVLPRLKALLAKQRAT
jgi:O-antigen/teichoic acid export membrane protein